MLKPAMLALCCLFAVATAHAADVQMGSVTLKLDTPANQCVLDASQKNDKRMIDFLTGSLAHSGLDLLGVSADCTELRDWRAGRLQFIGRFAEYQTPTAARSAPFGVAEVKASCEAFRTQGERMSRDVVASANESIQKFNKQINFAGQKFIGLVGDDPNGCYVAVFQKYKAENGKEVSQVSVFFHASIKDRALNIYFFAPYENDSSMTTLLALQRAHVAKVKAANGL